MTELDIIKSKIKKLYETNPNIHINVSLTRPRVSFTCEPAIITGVYPNIFQIEEQSSGSKKCRTIQYTDVLINRIEILELSEN